MDIAIVVGVVATAIALLGLLGREGDGRAWPSQVFVIALPLGIVAGGYAASIGATLLWVVVAVISVFAAVLAGALIGSPPALADQQRSPAASGLSLMFSALIGLGLAVIVIMWAAQLISAFSYLNDIVVKVVLVAAAAAYGLGGRAIKGLSRLVMILVIIGAVALLVVGGLVGDFGGLGSPLVPVPDLNAGVAILYAVGVVIIGAGFPMLREAAHNNRASAITAAILVAAVAAAALFGILAMYGGAFQLPSLVINVFPVYLPPVAAAILSGLITIIAVVSGGASIRTASDCIARIQPMWYSSEHRGPIRIVFAVMAVAVVIVAILAPSPVAIVSILAVLGAANLITERVIARAPEVSDEAPVGAGATST